MAPIILPNSGSKLLRITEHSDYYLLEFISEPDNRFTAAFCQTYMSALAYLQTECEPKVLITTSGIPKFFSNGLNLDEALSTPGFFPDCYYALMRTILEFPWPTIAWVNGHAFAAGFVCAACHDYIVMNPSRGFLCMNEVQFGAPLPAPMLAIFRARYGFDRAHEIVTTGRRYGGRDAFDFGLVSCTGSLPEAEAIAAKLQPLAASPSYGAIRRELWRSVIDDTLAYESEQKRLAENEQRISDSMDMLRSKL